MKVRERNVAHPNSLVLFPLANKSHTVCNIASERSLNFDGLGCLRVLASTYVKEDEYMPLLHRRALRPIVPSVHEQELDLRIHNAYSSTLGLLPIVMLLHPRVDRVSML